MISSILVLVLVMVTASCTTTRIVSPDELRSPDYPKDRELKLTYEKGTVILRDVLVVEWPLVEGEIEELEGEVPRQAVPNDPKRFRFDVSEAEKVEGYRFSRGKTAGLVGGILVGGALVVFIVIVKTFGGIMGGGGSGFGTGDSGSCSPCADSDRDDGKAPGPAARFNR